ncbi:Protein N-terminal glutamine amidohydrolase [Orbilia ellipsospora]|uniref:Protein N-terminal glutamine amidohydrolase n=1 Tax=Orbilia ellipsospora TaxID=2528407 RepID=A0AAV9XHA7_9PEZI
MELLELPPREALLYTSCYCEENIYKFVEQNVSPSSLPHYTVIFLSNKRQKFPIFAQKSQKSPVNPVVWDYHVILAYHPSQTLEELLRHCHDESTTANSTKEVGGGPVTKAYIYDLDTSIPTFPCPFPTYFSQSFLPPPSSQFLEPLQKWIMQRVLEADIYKRYFRLIPAKAYLECFWSSRGHMKNEDGSWKMPPPIWDAIKSVKAEDDTFGEYLDFTSCVDVSEEFEEGKKYLGVIVGEQRLWEILGGGPILDAEIIDAKTTELVEAALATGYF